MQWKPYLMGLLLALVVGQVTLLVAQIGGCPVDQCGPFVYCTSEAGDSQMLPCSYHDNSCTPPRLIERLYTSSWCCDTGSVLLTVGGCCQYTAEVFICVKTGRYQIWMVDGRYLRLATCDPNTGFCVYYAYA